MTSILPTIPKFIFCYLEPLSLVAGAVAPLIDPAGFVSAQVPSEPVHTLLPTEHLLVLQLGNLFALACLVGVGVLNTTTESKVVRAYIWGLWAADIGHVGLSAWAMGIEGVKHVSGWNALAWGNIGFTTFLFAARSLYLLGIFGPDKNIHKADKKLR